MTRSRRTHPGGVRGVALVPVLLALALGACSSSPRVVTLTILHTNDVHAHLERRGSSLGAAEVAGTIAWERREHGDVLVLDAGDAISGTPISSLTRGRAPFAVMGLMGYDAMALGNHEMDHGWRRVSEYRTIAPFPILCANAFAPDGGLLADAATETFAIGLLRVGVVGLLEEGALDDTVREGNEGVVVRSPIETARAIVPTLREDVHLVVALSHCGLTTDRKLAREVPGIDVIVGGHSHDAIASPERIGNTWIVQAGSDLRRMGKLTLRYDLRARRILEVEGELLTPAAPVHPEVAAAVQDLERDLAPRLDRVIGRTAAPLDRRRIQAGVEAVLTGRTGADAAFMNPGGVRRKLPAGPITVRAVWEALPFDNTIVVLAMKGSDLPGPWRARIPGPFDPDRTYRVATNSYVAQQQKKYLRHDGIPVEDTGIPLREAVLEAIERLGAMPDEKENAR